MVLRKKRVSEMQKIIENGELARETHFRDIFAVNLGP